MKVSKKVLLYIGIGAYIIITIASGYILFGKLGEQGDVSDELDIALDKLEQTDADRLTTQLNDLEVQRDQIKSQTETMRGIMSQNIENVKASTIAFDIAKSTYVEVMNLHSPSASSELFENVPCNVVLVEATIEGKVEDLVNFITQLNTVLSTGVIKSVTLNIPEADTGVKPTALISLLIYNYQEEL